MDLFLHCCFQKLPWAIWARVRLLAVPKPFNALLAASHLFKFFLSIKRGLSPPLS